MRIGGIRAKAGVEVFLAVMADGEFLFWPAWAGRNGAFGGFRLFRFSSFGFTFDSSRFLRLCHHVPPDQLRHARPCAGHPRLTGMQSLKTWMAGTRPAMTETTE